jgi:hypothetical protein
METELTSAAAVNGRTELARQVCAGVDHACEILLTGGEPALSVAPLRQAIEALRGLPSQEGIDPTLLRRMQTSIGRAERLVTAGAAFFAGWSQVISTHYSGYTAEGNPRPLTASGQVSLHG